MEDARGHYNFVLQQEPYHDGVLPNMGLVLLDTNEYTKAVETLEMCLVLYPKKIHEIARPLALAYHFAGNDSRAIFYYEQALQFNSNNAKLHFDFAVSLQDAGEVRFCKRYSNLLPSEDNILFKIVRANIEYNKAVALDPEYSEVLLNILYCDFEREKLQSLL